MTATKLFTRIVLVVSIIPLLSLAQVFNFNDTGTQRIINVSRQRTNTGQITPIRQMTTVRTSRVPKKYNYKAGTSALTGLSNYLLGQVKPGVVGGKGGPDSGGGSIPFGGMVGIIWGCSECSTLGEGLWLFVGPPKGGALFLGPGAQLHDNSNPAPGSWVLGDYAPIPGLCKLDCGPDPIIFPFIGNIIKMGTS